MPPPTPGSGIGPGGECFRLRHVQVHNLLEDGTLGLLLHGTSVVGFCSPDAEAFGWSVGDQIVEINGQRVAVFDEFLDRFMAAQDEGFPIDFSVLRRETADDPAEGAEHAEGALEDFFSATNFLDLAGQLQQKFGVAPAPTEAAAAAATSALPADDGDGQLYRSESITENPYIQALRKRRSELFRSAEGWTMENGESLAAKLATQRNDALATLLKRRQETPRVPSALPGCDAASGAGDLPQPLAWPVGLACGNRPCGSEQAMTYEIQPTPRFDPETEACQWEPVHAWAGFESPMKEAGDGQSKNFAVRLLANR